MQSAQPNPITYLIAGVMVIIILYFRGRRMNAKRPLKLGTLWIIPAIFLASSALTFVQFPPGPADWPWLGLALAAGAGLGWQRGRLMDIWVEKDGGQLMVQGSRWAMIFLIILVALRMAVRGGLDMESRAGLITPALVNDGFVVFALGLFATQRAEMALRGLRLTKEHCEARDSAP